MKKFLVILVLAISIFVILNQNVISWVRSNFTSGQAPYYQQRSEFFEALSQEYYGVPDYGNELAVVNRSFVIREVSTERDGLIIPSLDAINRLKSRQSLASVENQAGTQIVNTIRRLSKQAAERGEVSEGLEPSKSSMLILIIGIVLVSTIIAFVSYFKYRNKTKGFDLLFAHREDNPVLDESILVNFDPIAFDQKN